jgi:hypothetical protein
MRYFEVGIEHISSTLTLNGKLKILISLYIIWNLQRSLVSSSFIIPFSSASLQMHWSVVPVWIIFYYTLFFFWGFVKPCLFCSKLPSPAYLFLISLILDKFPIFIFASSNKFLCTNEIFVFSFVELLMAAIK